MLYTLRFFSSKCSLFHSANLFGSCVIHILYTGCAKIKKNNSGAKGLIDGFDTVTLASSYSALPDDGDHTETCWSCFNFNTPFKTILLCITR